MRVFPGKHWADDHDREGSKCLPYLFSASIGLCRSLCHRCQGGYNIFWPDRLDVAYTLEVNVWNDEKRLQLNVQDVREVSAPPPA